MKRKLILTISLLLLSLPSFAQIITPSLDPVVPTQMASANSWRFGSTIGAGTVYLAEKDEDTGDTTYTNGESTAMFAYQPSHVVVEIYAKSLMDDLDMDTTSDGNDERSQRGSIKMAIRGERTFSVGISYTTSETEYSAGKASLTSFGGSFSIRMLGGAFFAGAGMERVTAKAVDGEEGKWNEIKGGIAFQVGDPGGTLFRLEAATIMAPKVEFSTTSRSKKTIYQGAAELKTGKLLFTYQLKQTLLTEYLLDEDDMTITESTYGLGLDFSGLTVGLYRVDGKATAEGDWSDSTYELYALTCGFSFI